MKWGSDPGDSRFSGRVSHRLGHSSVATTTNIYGHLMKQAEEQISGRMEEIINRAKNASAEKREES